MDTEVSHTALPSRDRGATAERSDTVARALAAYAALITPEREGVYGARNEARAALSRYVEQLRAERVAPEHALIRVKMLAQSLTLGMETGARDALMAETVRWFFDAFYPTQAPDSESPRGDA